MRSTLLTCAILSLTLPVGTASDVKSVVARLETAYLSANTMRATFLERYKEGGRTVRVEAGVAYFRRPGKMRWEYESPEKSLYLVDGKTAWFYVPADHTVTEVPAKNSKDLRTPLAMLAGKMKVSHICARIEFASNEQPESADHAMLYCALRGAAKNRGQLHGGLGDSLDAGNSVAVFFEVVLDTGELARVLIRQAGGAELEFRFAQWQFDPIVPDSLFHFEPPTGVAIVNGELASEQSDKK